MLASRTFLRFMYPSARNSKSCIASQRKARVDLTQFPGLASCWSSSSQKVVLSPFWDRFSLGDSLSSSVHLTCAAIIGEHNHAQRERDFLRQFWVTIIIFPSLLPFLPPILCLFFSSFLSYHSIHSLSNFDWLIPFNENSHNTLLWIHWFPAKKNLDYHGTNSQETS